MIRHRFMIHIHPGDILAFLCGMAADDRAKLVWEVGCGLDLRNLFGDDEPPRIVGYGVKSETGEFFIEVEHPSFAPVSAGGVVNGASVWCRWEGR